MNPRSKKEALSMIEACKQRIEMLPERAFIARSNEESRASWLEDLIAGGTLPDDPVTEKRLPSSRRALMKVWHVHKGHNVVDLREVDSAKRWTCDVTVAAHTFAARHLGDVVEALVVTTPAGASRCVWMRLPGERREYTEDERLSMLMQQHDELLRALAS